MLPILWQSSDRPTRVAGRQCGGLGLDQLIAMTTDVDDVHVTVFEVDQEAESGLELASSKGGGAAQARLSFEEAIYGIRPSLTKLTELISALAPTEAEIEFGLKVGGETGIIIAKGTTEANFALKLVWKRPGTDADDGA